MFSHQPWDYAFGAGTALDRFAALGGKIVLLSCDHDNVTFLQELLQFARPVMERVARERSAADDVHELRELDQHGR